MKIHFIILLFPFLMLQKDTFHIDFGEEKKGHYWKVINDGVMGGISKGSKELTKNSMLYKGKVSLDNNGGFSSLRRSFSDKDISMFNEIEIRYRSVGISLAFTIAVSQRWYIPNYKISLDGTSSEWTTTTIKLSDLRKHYIGKPMNEMLKKETLKEIVRIGFITDEKKYGNFEFEIDFIKFK
tara:strand:+ start:11120 stop:11665 length:546 start_codon:yes stop_codon:yes gene_type:complete